MPYFSGFSEIMVPLFAFNTLSNKFSIERGLATNVSLPEILHMVSIRASSTASSPVCIKILNTSSGSSVNIAMDVLSNFPLQIGEIVV